MKKDLIFQHQFSLIIELKTQHLNKNSIHTFILIVEKHEMFSEFENMFKKPSDKPSFSKVTSQDYSKTPQKFNINGRQIQEKKLLAEGAFGFIWLAEDISTKQEFALKRVICLTPESIRSAVLEKNIMEKLPVSPHIVRYYGGLTQKLGDRTIIVTLMQLCPGGNLFDMLQKRQGKGIPEQTVKNIAESVLKALSVLHKEGIIHRDIKIENVLVGKDKKLKICDFGSCTTEVVDFGVIPKADYESVKESIQAFTTPMYRPPQIVDPYLKYQVTTKADLWMLGCTLYTMSYFIHPFVEANAVGISSGVFRFPTYPDETQYKVSQKMKDFIRNLLTTNPSYRPSAEKMLQILKKWEDLQAIPLNQDAKRLKKEHEEKQEENRRLNKKVVQHDGDIPIEELMKIQQKLKNQGQETFEKEDVSFITKKDTKIISQGLNLQNKEAKSIRHQPMSATSQKNVPKQAKNNTSNNLDFWSNSYSSSSGNSKPASNNKQTNSGFDAFDVFAKPPQPQKITVNSDNFHQFFATTSGVASNTNKSTKPSTEANLLDL